VSDINIAGFETVDIAPPQLDPGNYSVTIQTAPVMDSTDDGKDFLPIDMVVVNGPNQKSGANPTGKIYRDRVYLTSAASWRIKSLLVASGLMSRDDKASPVAKGQFNTQQLVGSNFQINITPNRVERDGQVREYRNCQYVVD
jgi:hypothetical protein